jgi:DNA polymerase III subunit alpha
VRKFYTKKNRQMAFVKIEDLTGSVELVIFPDLFERFSSLLEEDNLIIVEGRTDLKEEEDVKILIENIRSLNHDDRYYCLELSDDTDEALLSSLKDLLVTENGNIPVCIYFKKDKKTLILEEDYWVRDHPSCRERLEELLGRNAVREQRKNGEKILFDNN